jgi:hypothetical protein
MARFGRNPVRNHFPGFAVGSATGNAHMAVRQTTETPVVRTSTEAREGVTGHGIRYVLLFGTGAVIVLFAAIWLFYFH